MRDINQKASDTDKQIAIALRCCDSEALASLACGALCERPRGDANRSFSEDERASAQSAHSAMPNAIALRRPVWQNYLKTLGAISTGGLSIFAVAALLGVKPAQANITDQSASLPNQTADEEQVSPTSSQSSELDAQAKLSQGQPGQAVLAPTQRPEALAQPSVAQQDTITSFARIPAFTPKSLTQATEYNFAPSAIERGNSSSLQPQASMGEAAFAVPRANSLSFASDGKTSQNPNSQAQVSQEKPATVLPAFVPPPTEHAPTQNSVEPQVPQPQGTESEQPTTILPGIRAGATAFSPTQEGVEYKVLEKSAQGMQPTTILPTVALRDVGSPTLNSVEPSVPQPVVEGNQPTTILPTVALRDVGAPTLNSVKPSVPKSMAGVAQPTMVAQVTAPDATAATSEPYSGPGAARLLGDNIQAQSSIDAAQEAQSENALRTNNPLAPSLVFQGGFITQGEKGARARLTGLYPVSPNLLFWGTVDLTTGEGFSDTAGTGLDITELYFTTSLPSYPNLRLTAGLLDLTSYFDRNSFAKDSLTHFFNPVFQTNPALARTGIASRPAALLTWDITDNINARVAGFSSSRSLGELAPDGFAGELAYRFDNGIIRATYATDRDDQKNGFKEIYGIPRGNGNFGPRSSDRESSYGINAEYYIPEIKMGLFGRYGHYENTSMGRGGETYSAGLNFLDLFMKNDRLGFGYGRDLSSSSLRRANKAKLPDVWEVFYDFRLTSYLRAGVTLQARDEFSDLVAGFRVKTEFDLLNLGRAFK